MGWENQPILISLLFKEVVDIKKEKNSNWVEKWTKGMNTVYRKGKTKCP